MFNFWKISQKFETGRVKVAIRKTTCVIFFVTPFSNNFEEIDEADVQILILLVLGLSTMTAYFRLLVAVLRLLQNH